MFQSFLCRHWPKKNSGNLRGRVPSPLAHPCPTDQRRRPAEGLSSVSVQWTGGGLGIALSSTNEPKGCYSCSDHPPTITPLYFLLHSAVIQRQIQWGNPLATPLWRHKEGASSWLPEAETPTFSFLLPSLSACARYVVDGTVLAPRRPNTNMGSPCGPKALGAEQQAGPGQPPNTAAAAGSAATWGSCGERSEKLNNNPAESTLVGISAQFILKPLLFAINFHRTSSLRRHNHFFFARISLLSQLCPLEDQSTITTQPVLTTNSNLVLAL